MKPGQIPRAYGRLVAVTPAGKGQVVLWFEQEDDRTVWAVAVDYADPKQPHIAAGDDWRIERI